MEQTQAPPSGATVSISLTEKAAAEVRRIMSEQGYDESEYYLRFGVKGGGCSGFTYVLGFENTATEADTISESQGIRIATDNKSLIMVTGVQIDFESDMMNRHFVFNNPNASRTCGCGTSFGV